MSTVKIADHELIDDTLAEVRRRATKEVLTQQIDEFIEVISSDGFLDYINGIADLPTHRQRREETEKTANIPTLQDYDVPTPEGLRLTTRQFELPEDGATATSPLVKVRPGLDPRMGWCVSVGFYVCASYGG